MPKRYCYNQYHVIESKTLENNNNLKKSKGDKFMIIGIDHGNSQIKTENCVFASGLRESKTKLPMATDQIHFNGKYYSLTHSRIPYMRDKTVNDSFFILTLFAIAKELQATESALDDLNLTLAVGLPPEHFAKQRYKFGEYFKKFGKYHKFQYNNKNITINIENIRVFPQAYAALISDRKLFKKYSRAYVIDIGGYTVDVMQMIDYQPDLSICRSLNLGVIKMANDIISHIDTNEGITIKEEHVIEVLSKEKPDVILKPSVVKEIRRKAEEHSENIISKLRELDIDLRVDPAIMIGGGSMLLKQYFSVSEYIARAEYIEDIHANAKGYAMLTSAMMKSGR